MNLLKTLTLSVIFSLLFIACDDNSANNPNNENAKELKMLKTYPANGNIFENQDSSLWVKFDNKIYIGTGSVKILNFGNNSLVEKIPPANITITDSTLYFKITAKLENENKYYV